MAEKAINLVCTLSAVKQIPKARLNPIFHALQFTLIRFVLHIHRVRREETL